MTREDPICPRWCTFHDVDGLDVFHRTRVHQGETEVVLTRTTRADWEADREPDVVTFRALPSEMNRADLVEFLAVLECLCRRMLRGDLKQLPEPRSQAEQLGRTMLRAAESARGRGQAVVR